MTDTAAAAQPTRGLSLARIESALPWIALGLVGLLLPLLDDSYIGVIAQRATFTANRQIWRRSALPWVDSISSIPAHDSQPR